MGSWIFFHWSCQYGCVMWCSCFNVNCYHSVEKKQSVAWLQETGNSLSISVRRQLYTKSSFCDLKANIFEQLSYYMNKPKINQLEYTKKLNFYFVLQLYGMARQGHWILTLFHLWPTMWPKIDTMIVHLWATGFSNKVTSPSWLPDEIMYHHLPFMY